MPKTKKIPKAAREFAKEVNAAVHGCETGALTEVECLEALHSLTNSHHTHELFAALRVAEGNPLPEVIVETVPLECEECGEYHTGDEWEAWYAKKKGKCPKAMYRTGAA